MNLYLQHHNVANEGLLLSDPPFSPSLLGLHNRRLNVQKTVGRVFLIAGIGRPRRYFLWETFEIEEFTATGAGEFVRWTAKTDVSYNEQSFTCLTFALSQATKVKNWLTVSLAQSKHCLKEQKRSAQGTVTRTRGKERGGGYAMLIDSMQEHMARIARAGKHGSDPKFYAEAVKEIELYQSIVRDKETKLWHQGRGWIKDHPDEVSPGTWSRGHGSPPPVARFHTIVPNTGCSRQHSRNLAKRC